MIQRILIFNKSMDDATHLGDGPASDQGICCPRLSGQSRNLHNIPAFGQYWLGKLDFPSSARPGVILERDWCRGASTAADQRAGETSPEGAAHPARFDQAGTEGYSGRPVEVQADDC